MNNGQTERASAEDGLAANIARGAGVIERAAAGGVFRSRALGPRERQRATYVSIRDRILELEACARAALENARELLDLRRRLAAFELEEKWSAVAPNVVTEVGGNDILDKYLAGSSYTATLYLGLISSVSYGVGPAVGDTMSSHAGWTEAGPTNAPDYSESTRQAPTFGAASGIGTSGISSWLMVSSPLCHPCARCAPRRPCRHRGAVRPRRTADPRCSTANGNGS
mgnify:CR=1 FL=1